MPNYSLQINSRFRPFSFQEMASPWQMYGQAYKELADSYTSLGVQAGDIASMLNKELDKEAYNQYENYMQGIRDSASALASEGMSPTLRNNAYSLTNRYAQEIRPIQKAAERRQLLAEEQRKLGNNYIFDFDAATTGLDRFINNPTINYRRIDRMELLKEAQDQFSQFQNDLVSFNVDPSLYKDAFHNTLVSKYGFTPEEAASLSAQVASGNVANVENEAVRRIADNLYNSTNVSSWNNDEASNRVWSTIAEGIKAGVGKTTPQVIEDIKKHEDYKYQKELDTYKKKLQAKAAAEGSGNRDMTQSIYRYGSASQYMTKHQRELADNIQELQGLVKYFEENPDAYTNGSNVAEAIDAWKENNKFGTVTLSLAERAAAKNRIRGQHKEDEDKVRRLNELSDLLSKEYTNEGLSFDFGVEPGQNGNVFRYNSNLDKITTGLAEQRRPVLYRMNQESMKSVTKAVRENIDIQGSGKNALIRDEEGNSLSSKAFNELSKLNWDKARIFFHHGKEFIVFPEDGAKKYELLPGALGDISDMYRPVMDSYYSNKDYDNYEKALINYMNAVYGEFNTELQGQPGTNSKMNFNLYAPEDEEEW